MRIAILGTRGIPNQYGGFEELAEHLAEHLSQDGHLVTVYQTHNHSYHQKEYKGATLISRFNPEVFLGTFGQFFYDLFCLLHARRQNFDICLHLGYTSNTLWYWLWPKGAKHISNMDGLEWKRSKYAPLVQRFLGWAEKIAATKSDHCIADHPVIAEYVNKTYGVQPTIIGYGATHIEPSKQLPSKLSGVKSFDLLMARMEPENHVHTILEAHANGGIRPLVICGNTRNSYSRQLLKKYPPSEMRIWLGGVYDKSVAARLRRDCSLYFHGHSVGGTNPSLIQAMASGCAIVAHENPFNRTVIGENALGYFADKNDLESTMKEAQPQRVKYDVPDWQSISDAYAACFFSTMEN
ncbi:MAG: DUF1972 domain-containing protein [Cryomorphaceae bacterium]|nr:DUF1972 domain-containing protein [Cryomorphaceae bacterium]